MKNYIVLLILFISVAASAQYNNRYGNGPGVDRRLTNQQQSQSSESKKIEKPDMVALTMKKLDEELKLDSFQSAVIAQLLKDNEEKETKIIEEDIPSESKGEKITVLRLQLHEKIKEILNPEQIILFDNLKNKKKKKK